MDYHLTRNSSVGSKRRLSIAELFPVRLHMLLARPILHSLTLFHSNNGIIDRKEDVIRERKSGVSNEHCAATEHSVLENFTGCLKPNSTGSSYAGLREPVKVDSARRWLVQCIFHIISFHRTMPRPCLVVIKRAAAARAIYQLR